MSDVAQTTSQTFHMAPLISCAPCHRLIPISAGNPIADFLAGAGPTCPSCGKPVDVWESTLSHLATFGQIGMLPLGPVTTIIAFDLPPNGRTTIRLADHGIPADARILERSYCGQGSSGVFPLECHGGSPRGAPFYDGAITLYGATFPPGSDVPQAETSKQQISITWVPSGVDVDGWSGLWSALESYARYDHQGVVIPANTAVELTTDRVVTSFLSAIPDVSKENLGKFMGDVAYHHRLNVLLPAIAHLIGAPPFMPKLRADLNLLKTLRNQVGHTGRTKQKIERTEAARLVRAALFGFHYVHIIESHLRKNASADSSSRVSG